MNQSTVTCPICSSIHLTRVNSYKHHCYACSDCNNIFHVRKEGKYLLEWFLPRALFKKLLPPKAFLRLFRDRGDIGAADFYDVYATECAKISPVRESEVAQLLDQLSLAGISLADKRVLDISGGPGYVAKQIKGDCARIVVTEFSELATRAMRDVLGIETVKFDYTTDRLENLFTEKFDLVLIRSSIIFCPQLDEFVASLRNVLTDEGQVLIETIMPTLGDVLWWQQMEYKFPIIYSQETLEKYFYKNGFYFMTGYRDYGSYTSIKGRSTQGLAQKAYTWLIDYPMVLFYSLFASKSRVAIDQGLYHKMLTQIWQRAPSAASVRSQPYRNFTAGEANKSTHFAYTYNGYLKK